MAQDVGFTGREYDAETGLYHYRARTYDPVAGRFLQADPLGFAAGDLNLYAYTWNDPANWTDPSGLSAANENSTLSTGMLRAQRVITRRVGKAAQCLANRVGTLLTSIGAELISGGDVSAAVISQVASCVMKVRTPCGCQRPNRLMQALGVAAAAYGLYDSLSSFPAGTEVQTPDGPVRIEALREGDLVLARDEATGQSGIFPVTAVMQRQAGDVLWLVLERADGATTRMGVTALHPLFLAGEGWVAAGEVAPGDLIRDRDLQPLTVLAVEVDDAPRMVHNLEVAGAHTYFAGELEAWGHNARRWWSGGHVWNNHVRNNEGKSTFCKPSALPRLILRTLQSPDTTTLQSNGNTKYTRDFGRTVGISRCGNPASSIVVIKNPNGKIVTA